MHTRKTDFLDYLKQLSHTTLLHHNNFINQWYDLFSLIDEQEYNSISMDSLTDAEYYVMNYSIPHVGRYKVYFNIDKIIQSDAYKFSSIHTLSENELDLKRVNHPVPFDMNIYLLNQFQLGQKNIKDIKYYPIITDSCDGSHLYTVIDGNHRLEISLREEKLVNVKYISFDLLNHECYGNMFSFLLHHFMNEMHHLLYPNYNYLLSENTSSKERVVL